MIQTMVKIIRSIKKYTISLPSSLPDGNVGPTKDANNYTGGDSTIPGLLKKKN